MKKIALLTMLLICNIMQLSAQGDLIVNISDYQGQFSPHIYVCLNDYQRVLIYAEEGCTDFHWNIGMNSY